MDQTLPPLVTIILREKQVTLIIAFAITSVKKYEWIRLYTYYIGKSKGNGNIILKNKLNTQNSKIITYLHFHDYHNYLLWLVHI